MCVFPCCRLCFVLLEHHVLSPYCVSECKLNVIIPFCFISQISPFFFLPFGYFSQLFTHLASCLCLLSPPVWPLLPLPPPPHSCPLPSYLFLPRLLSPCPVSSDLYKSLQSGSQVALPPHLQLAFSGKIWPSLHLKACSTSPAFPRFQVSCVLSRVVLFYLFIFYSPPRPLLVCWWQHAFFIFFLFYFSCVVILISYKAFTDASSSLSRCQSKPRRRRQEEDAMMIPETSGGGGGVGWRTDRPGYDFISFF